MRPSDEQVEKWLETVQQQPGWRRYDHQAYLAEEVRRARAAEVETEAKLREAETIITKSIAALGGDYAPEQVPEAIKQAFVLMEKAERERDEARGTGRGLISLVMDLAPYPPEVAEAVLALVESARAALGEKP